MILVQWSFRFEEPDYMFVSVGKSKLFSNVCNCCWCPSCVLRHCDATFNEICCLGYCHPCLRVYCIGVSSSDKPLAHWASHKTCLLFTIIDELLLKANNIETTGWCYRFILYIICLWVMLTNTQIWINAALPSRENAVVEKALTQRLTLGEDLCDEQ